MVFQFQGVNIRTHGLSAFWPTIVQFDENQFPALIKEEPRQATREKKGPEDGKLSLLSLNGKGPETRHMSATQIDWEKQTLALLHCFARHKATRGYKQSFIYRIVTEG